MVRMILTHPGGAHKDDLLAVCILAAQHGAPIVRREPTSEELNDPEVAIVDIGGDHGKKRPYSLSTFRRIFASARAFSGLVSVRISYGPT